MAGPKVAVVVPVHGRLPLTVRFLESFRAVTYDNYEVVVVDDGSADGTGAYLARHFPWVRLLRGDGGLWWAGCAYVLTINNDAVVRPDFLARLVDTARRHPRSIVGSRINYLDDPTRVWGAGGYTYWEEYFILRLHDNGAREADVLARGVNPAPVEFLTGCGALVPAGCYRAVGLYDARMCPQYHADAEFTLRTRRRGWRVLVDLGAVVYNDARHTCPERHLLRRRSPHYWRPVLALHLRYCPRRHLLASLCRQYVETVVDQLYPAAPGDDAPPLVRLRLAARRLRRAARRLLRSA
jgi:GT2 family glycosyltransferase